MKCSVVPWRDLTRTVCCLRPTLVVLHPPTETLGRKDYRDHRDKILSKFVSMIEELIDARSGSLKLTDWDTQGLAGGGGGPEESGSASGSGGAGGAGGGEPCQFTADLRKAVTAMHNVLHQQLPPEQLQVLYCTVLYYTFFFLFFPELSRSWRGVV